MLEVEEEFLKILDADDFDASEEGSLGEVF